MTNIRALLLRLPLWTRKAIVDIVESAVAAVVTFNFVFPAGVDDAKKGAATVLVAVTYAVVAALRRALPDALIALRGLLGVGAQVFRG